MINNLWELAETLIEKVKSQSVSVTITVQGDESMEVTISPWESYQPRCPYSREENKE